MIARALDSNSNHEQGDVFPAVATLLGWPKYPTWT
jgi:hypothetical protein